MGLSACESSNERVSVFSVCVFECISVDVCGGLPMYVCVLVCVCVFRFV